LEFRVSGFNYFTEMGSGSEEGSYLRRIDFVFHSTLGLRVIKKKKTFRGSGFGSTGARGFSVYCFRTKREQLKRF